MIERQRQLQRHPVCSHHQRGLDKLYRSFVRRAGNDPVGTLNAAGEVVLVERRDAGIEIGVCRGP